MREGTAASPASKAPPSPTPPSLAGGAAQPSSLRQPAAQTKVIGSQCCAAGQVSAEATQRTQRPVAVSHTAPPGSVVHWSLERQPDGTSGVSLASAASLASMRSLVKGTSARSSPRSAAASAGPPTTELPPEHAETAQERPSRTAASRKRRDPSGDGGRDFMGR